MNTASTIVIIPARSGSKSIKDKNIQRVGSKSLLQYSIDFAQELVGVDKVLVSTNSLVYASIARRHGAWVPFLRPEEISGDRSKDIEVMRHATNWMIENGFMDVETVVWLRPSYPIRDSDFVNRQLVKFKQDDSSCSLRSVRLASESPYKMWTLDQSNELHRVIGELEDDLHNSPRQILPEIYWQDGYIDVYHKCYINGSSCHHQKKFSGALTPENALIKDIDHKSDLDLIQETLNAQDSLVFRSIEAAEKIKYSS